MTNRLTATSLVDALEGTGRLIGSDVPLADLFHDSRDVVPRSGFIAVRGANVDGHDYLDAAVAAGASVVVVERESVVDCAQVVVADTRQVMAELATVTHGRPAESLTMIGITGTNGKTTVTYMLEAIMAASDRRSAVVGTVGARIAGHDIKLHRTTPEATDLQRLLRHMVESKVAVAAIEVSSHAIVLGRVDSIRFDVVGFTNLSQDHLDFHRDMEHYFDAKADLFTARRAHHGVVWVDDPAGCRLAAQTSIETTTVGFGGSACDVSGDIAAADLTGTDLVVRLPSQEFTVRLPLAGKFNAANALVATAIASHIGVEPGDIVSGLASMSAVPGRFERIRNDQGIAVIVDYAHTPEAVASIVHAVSPFTDGRVIVVCGAAGDRDPLKRGQMGRAASGADVVVVTSDNPRSESPEKLVREVSAGVDAGVHLVAEVDRGSAIRHAIRIAASGDTVLILGKGHEPFQEFADRSVEFDDRLVAAAALQVGQTR